MSQPLNGPLAIRTDRTGTNTHPQPLPLAGGGFQWSRSVDLLRRGEYLAQARASDVTLVGDEQRPGLAAENAALLGLARPGDRLLVHCWTRERGRWCEEWLVASPPRPRPWPKVRPWTYAEDALVRAGADRPWRLQRRAERRAERLAALKKAAKERGRQAMY